MSAIDTQFLKSLLDFPADALDKKQIQYVFDMCQGKSSSSSDASKPKKTRKSKSKDETSEDKKDKPKRKLNDKLAARNACWAAKKAAGMAYKDFIELWKSMTDDEKAKYSPSTSNEVTSAENSDNDDEKKSSNEEDVSLDDIEDALNKLENDDDDHEEKKETKKKVKKETKKASTKSKTSKK